MKADFICLDCTLPICDETHRDCLYVAKLPKKERVKQSNVVRTQTAFTERAKLRTAIAALGFKKYDRRRKPDTPQRTLWRLYKGKQNDGKQQIAQA